MKTHTLLLCLVLFVKISFAETINWKFTTNDKIHSTPTIENGIAYIGSDDNKLYAINIETGALVWTYETDYAVKSIPLVLGNSIFITVASSLHRINKNDGTSIAIYNSDAVLNGSPKSFIDSWDYHTSSAYEYNGNIYFGDEYGNIQVFNTISNEGKTYYTTDELVAIRTTVTISDSVMFFGDWNGKAYALSMKTKELNWKYSSYDSRPYSSFGPYVTQPVIYNNKVYIGARNNVFAVLDINDGSQVWNYTDANGGWITGTPLFVNDTLYLGGSDNKEMIAFNPENGEVYWVYKTRQNVFCKAAYTEGYIIFTDGDSYNHNSGEGFVSVLKSCDGSLVNQYALNANVYSSPQVINNKLLFGAYNSEVYCFDLNKLTRPELVMLNIDKEPIDVLTIENKNNDYFEITISNPGEMADSVSIECYSENEDIANACDISSNSFILAANEIKTIKVKINSNNLETGTYSLTISAKSQNLNELLNKTCNIVIPLKTKVDDKKLNGFNFYPNPVKDVLNCNLQLNENALVELAVYSLEGKLVFNNFIGELNSGTKTVSVNFNGKIKSGSYIVAVKLNEQLANQTMLFVTK